MKKQIILLAFSSLLLTSLIESKHNEKDKDHKSRDKHRAGYLSESEKRKPKSSQPKKSKAAKPKKEKKQTPKEKREQRKTERENSSKHVAGYSSRLHKENVTGPQGGVRHHSSHHKKDHSAE